MKSEIEKAVTLPPEEWKEYLCDLYAIRDGYINSAKCIQNDRKTNPDILKQRIVDYQRQIDRYQAMIDAQKEALSDVGQEKIVEYTAKAREIDKKIKTLRQIRTVRTEILNIMK